MRKIILIKLVLILVTFLVLIMPVDSQASIVTVEFAGYVVNLFDNNNLLEGAIQIGDDVTGSYTYDTSTQMEQPSSPTIGVYYHYDPPYGIEVNIGDYLFKTDPNNVDFSIAITDNYEGQNMDEYVVLSQNNLALSNGLLLEGICWDIRDNTGLAISSLELLETAPVLSDWQTNVLNISGGTDETFKITFGIDITITKIIPEPATLLLVGLGGLLLRKRK